MCGDPVIDVTERALGKVPGLVLTYSSLLFLLLTVIRIDLGGKYFPLLLEFETKPPDFVLSTCLCLLSLIINK